MASITETKDGKLEVTEQVYNSTTTAMEFSTDDESTGQRCSAHKDRQLHVDLNLEKIISKTKSDSMFELRKLTYQQRPVSEFGSKHTLEEHLASRSQPALANGTESRIAASKSPLEATSVEAPSNISACAQKLEPAIEERTPAQHLRPEEIQQDMQILQDLRVVNGILQGPIQEEIDRTLREGMIEQRPSRRRPRPHPRPRPEAGEEGGDEMSQPPVGRLLAPNGRSRRQRGRRVHFRPQVPTPNADGQYPVPRRNQSVIVEQLRQSPALNSLGDEARDEIVAEVGSLVTQQLVTSALSGEFRGILELHIQSRADQISHGLPLGRHSPHSYYSDDERVAPPSSANVQELREDMTIMKGQLNELKQMMRVSFDLQLDIQRAIRQEVSAALTAFLSQTDSATASGGACVTPAACPVPTLASPGGDTSSSAIKGGGSGRVNVVESGHCVICSEGVIDSVIYHCGHMCTCTACGLELKSKALKCPICRAPITDVIRAYTSML